MANELTLKQGTNDAWFIYSGNKLIAASHYENVARSILDFLNTQELSINNPCNQQN